MKIYYAEPPIGDLRWKALVSYQRNQYHQKIIIFVYKDHQAWKWCRWRNNFVGNEDCLYLDIFAPKRTYDNSLPVMFWIHGGGNTSGLKDLYDFSKVVSKHEVIVENKLSIRSIWLVYASSNSTISKW